jgi:hypothetical protein
MTHQEVPCPTVRCRGVLRYDLAQRGDGFIAKCEPQARWTASNGECGREFRWAAVREEWERSPCKWDWWRWLGIPTVDLPWPV